MSWICVVVSVVLSALFAPTSAVFEPSIATVHPGDSQVFTCSSKTSGVDFKFKATSSKIVVVIYSQVVGRVDPKYATKYVVNSANGDYNIQVLNASAADAGTYSCDDDTEDEEAELVVLAPATTSCVTNTSAPDTTVERCVTEFRFECNVGFHGNFPPNIVFWNVSGGQTIGPIRPTEQNVDSSISRNVLSQNLSSYFSNSRFLCRVVNSKRNDSPVQTICTSVEILPSCDTMVGRGDTTNVLAIVLPIVIGLCVVLLLILLLALWKCRRQKLTLSRQGQPLIGAPNGGTTEEVMLLSETPDILRPSSTTSKLEELIELLSDGGYYEVYKARHSEYGIVSFKKRCLDRMSDECGDKFRKEADGARQLSHQNIVNFRDIIFENAEGSSTGTYGIVYEYLENGNLSDFIEMSPLDLNQKLSLIFDVASGMKYLHSQTPQIIHGDLRIENILIGFNFKAKVSDFSFAQWKLYSQSHSKRKVGYETIAPYPPEFVSGPSPSNRKLPSFDVYSFGILFWETLTQRKPFAGSVITAILSRWIEHGKRPDEKLIPSEVPQFCKNLMSNCWSHNIDDRPTFNEISVNLQKELNLLNFSNISDFEMNKTNHELTVFRFYHLPLGTEKEFTIDKATLRDLKPLPDGGYLNGFKAKHSQFGTVVYKELSLAGISEDDVNTVESEAEILCRLNHPNLVRMLSLVTSGDKTYGFITSFHENGNLLEYVRTTGSPWIRGSSLLHDVACGMRYIHGQTTVVIHGDLKIENVLVSVVREIPIAKICDFGLPQWKSCSQASSRGSNVRFGTLAITPPEHLVNPDLQKDTTFDVYSFGVLMYQIIFLRKPFEEPNADIVTTWVTRGRRPTVDTDNLPDGVTLAIIQLMEHCWRQTKEERPDFESITEDLRREMKSPNLFKANDVRIIEQVQYVANNIKKIDGFFAIITVDHENLGRVTIKKPNVKVLKYKHLVRLAKEASAYQRLNHRNVVRFLGIVVEPSFIEGINIQPEVYGMVFEHAGDNTLAEYLRINKNLSWDRKLPLMLDVASGLEYLHACKPPVTHGNLKIDNVFVKEDGQTIIAKVFNFGFSLENERNSSASIANFPPENLENPHHPKLESFDVYGFAMLTWQVMTPTQTLPFSKELSEDASKDIYDLVVHDKIRPGLQFLSPDVSKNCIDLMQRCWSSSEQDRPHFREIAEELRKAIASVNNNNNNNSNNNNLSISVEEHT